MKASVYGGMRLLGLVAALVLAGCVQQKAKTPVAVAPPPAPVAPAPAPAPVRQPQLVIGVLAPLTGVNAAVGQSVANAANLAVLDLRDPRLRVIVEDTAAGPVTAAERAIASGARIFAGPLLSSNVSAVAPVAQASRVPVLALSNDASLATGGTFVMGYQADQEVERVVRFAREQGVRRFAALVPQGRYGELVARALRTALRDTGGELVALETYPRDRAKLFAAARRISAYEARLAKARAALRTGTQGKPSARLDPPPFQALLIAESGELVRAFLPALQQFGVDNTRVRFLGTGLWATDPTLANEQMLTGAWFASVPDGTFRQVEKRYEQRFGLRPSRLAALGYDAVLLAAAGLDRWRPGEDFPVAVLNAPEGFVGVDGALRFRNAIARRAMEVQEIGNGRFRTVSAAPARLGDPDKPIN